MARYLSVTQATVLAAVTAIVGQVVAFVPALAPDKQILISAGSFALSIAILGAHALVHHAAIRARPVAAPAVPVAPAAVAPVVRA